jgi:hypothetical protein
MRPFVPRLLIFPALMAVLALGLTSCGGGNGGGTGVPTKVTINPVNVSLSRGQVFQVAAAASDAKDNIVNGDVTWTSDNTKLVSVSSTGLLCGGTWDAKNIVCTPATDNGTPTGAPISGVATLTATIKGVAGTVKVFVHDKIDRVVASAPAGCSSMTETKQFTALAISNDADVCSRLTPAATPPCTLPSDSVGPATWGGADPVVVSLDNTAEKAGLATAVNPGTTNIVANLSGVNSPGVSFETCRVKSITLAIQNSTSTSFAIDKAATQALVATVVDSKGTTLTAPPISYVSSQPFAVTTAAQTTVTNATATAVNPGTSTIVAACAPPNCNKNLAPVYSSVITGNVNGTAVGTVYAASTDSLSVVPIDVATNTAAAAITLPRAPDSMVVNRQGTRVLLGSTSVGIMALDPPSGAVTSANRFGTVLDITPDGATAGLVDTPNNAFLDYTLSSGSFQGGYSTGTAITRIDPFIDSSAFFGVNGTTKYYSLFPTTFAFVNVTAPAVDIAVSGAGSAVYLAGGSAAGIDVRAVCDASEVDTQTASNPKLIAAVPNGSGAVAVDDTSLVVLHDANISSACPPVVTESRTAVALPLAAGYVARQVLVTPDSLKAIVSTDKGLVVVRLDTLVATKVVTAGTFTGGVTLDSKAAYFGADDGSVHRIDMTPTTPTDATSIAVNLKKADNSAAMPNLVVVRNK